MNEAVELCRELVKFKTDNSQCREAMKFFKSWLEGIGFKVRILSYASSDGRQVDNLYARYGTGTPHLLFSGHMDVVESGDTESWKCSPFAAEVVNDVLYGRGVADMKGGTAGFAAACKEFVKSHNFSGSISLVISGDEEEPIVDGTKKVLEQISAEGEKFDFCLVGEPSNPQNIGDEIKVGRRGDMVLYIKSIGRQGHTAYPHLADNPLHHLIQLLAKMTAFELDGGNDFFDPSTLQITTVDTGNKASNIIPAEAEATVDIRFNVLHTPASLTAWVDRLIAETPGNFKYKALVVGEPFLSPIDNNLEKLVSAVKEISGRTPALTTGGGTSDARFVKDFCPVVEFGLTNSSIHKVNECETTENLTLLCEIYQRFLVNYFC